MSAAGPLMYFGGSVLRAVSEDQAGRDRQDAYDQNARIAEENANESIRLSLQQERQIRIIGRKVTGDMKANYAASGIVGGSANDVLAESFANIERDVQNVRDAGKFKSDNYKREAANYRSAGRAARQAGRVGAVASLLGAAPTFTNMLPGSK